MFWRVEIAERDYSGTSEEIEFSGNDPLLITWGNRGDEFFVPVKASEATITVMCHENFHYLGLFTSNLANVPFLNSDNTKISGLQSLWDILVSCIDMQELDASN